MFFYTCQTSRLNVPFNLCMRSINNLPGGLFPAFLLIFCLVTWNWYICPDSNCSRYHLFMRSLYVENLRSVALILRSPEGLNVYAHNDQLDTLVVTLSPVPCKFCCVTHLISYLRIS